tara:strand:- start:108 stop:1268 length:1161 start_codon:yes stop_codon:yes gene_type:complete
VKISIFGSSSTGLLVRLIAAHTFGTLFAYTVYARFTQLGDRYESNDIATYLEMRDGEGLTSTIFTLTVYSNVGSVLPSFLSPMLLGIFIAIFTWLAFRDVYTHLNNKLFWTCNLFPHFLIWSGTASKEQLVILSGMVIINFAAKRSFAAKNLSISLIFVLLAMLVILLIRPNYFVIYFVIFTTALISPWLHRIVSRRLSVGVWVLIFCLLTIGVATYLALTSAFFSEDVIDFMDRVQNSFYAYSSAGSNRYDIQWEDLYDFLYNSLWGIPQGFIGPTLIEGISKPVQFPAFLEGILYLSILSYLFFKLLQLSIKSRILRLHIVPYIYVCFAIVFVSYPYLMFNPGSALRYKQSMHPILIFYPLLILAYYRANHFMKTKIKKIPDEH